MSDVGKVLRKTSKFAAKAIGTGIGFVVGGPVGAAAGYKAGDVAGDAVLGAADKGLGAAGIKAPKAQIPKPPGIPTLDTAAQNQQVTDRIRMRRGVLSTIYGGASNSAPAVATKTLLGS